MSAAQSVSVQQEINLYNVCTDTISHEL